MTGGPEAYYRPRLEEMAERLSAGEGEIAAAGPRSPQVHASTGPGGR